MNEDFSIPQNSEKPKRTKAEWRELALTSGMQVSTGADTQQTPFQGGAMMQSLPFINYMIKEGPENGVMITVPKDLTSPVKVSYPDGESENITD